MKLAAGILQVLLLLLLIAALWIVHPILAPIGALVLIACDSYLERKRRHGGR